MHLPLRQHQGDVEDGRARSRSGVALSAACSEPSSPGPDRVFARDALHLVVAQYLAAGLALLGSLYAARQLGPTGYGEAAIVIALPTLLLSLMSVKTISVTPRYASGFRRSGRHKQLLAVCKLGFLLDAAAAALVVAVVTLAVLVDVPISQLTDRTSLVLLFSASFLPASLAGTSNVALAALGRFSLVARLQALEAMLLLLAVALLTTVRPTVASLVIATAVAQALAGMAWGLAATVALTRDHVGVWWSVPLRTNAPIARELRAQLGWSYVGTTVTGMSAQAPILALGALGSARDAAYFRLSSSLAMSASYVETALARVAYPRLSAHQATRDHLAVRRDLRRWSRREALLGAALVALVVPVVPTAVPALFGHAYRPMVPGAQVLLAAAAVSTALFYVQPFLYSAGLLPRVVRTQTMCTLVTLALIIPVTARFGFLGAAVLTAAGHVVLRTALARSLVLVSSGSPPRPNREYRLAGGRFEEL